MKITSIGGGPAGLYFSLLMKKADPRHEITVYERNRPGDTFGFGVVFSDATLGHLEDADSESFREITRSFWHWDDIHIFHKGTKVVSRGHGFAGMSRRRLLEILEARAVELGVEVRHEAEVSDIRPHMETSDLVIGCDGVNSGVRSQLADHFKPLIDWRPNRFVWLGTTFPFEAFTFWFGHSPHGLWRVHAYRYEEAHSTFIVEGTEETFERAGFKEDDQEKTIAYFENLFGPQLQGHPLLSNRSIWRRFPTINNESWHHENVVLLGDAAHTAHFSIGSGTKLAMEDAIMLRDAVTSEPDVRQALEVYDAKRRPGVLTLQRAAQVSLEWFENTERYQDLSPNRFAFSLLTRSLRVTHENLKKRDPALVHAVDKELRTEVAERTQRIIPAETPPMFTPLKLRDLVLENRVAVSPMCMYSAEDGEVNDFHLVHLGSRAMGGAGLVIAEMTDVSPEGRITEGCAGLYHSRHVPAWRRITEFVHLHTAAKIGIQLGHAGRKGSMSRPWEGDAPLKQGAWQTVAPSPVPYTPGSPTPRELSAADMASIIDDHRKATRYAEQAGFDLIEVHMAHGYLLSSFLSPLTNLRTDAFGGDVSGRLRFPLAVLEAVRAEWPHQKPISVRISATDWADGGLSPEEAVEIAKQLSVHGADIIDVSGGGVVAHQRPRYGRLFQTPYSELIRLEARVPTMTVGAISSWADMNGIIAAGRADLCVLARGHLYDPYFTRHAAKAQNVDLPWPPPYHMARTFSPRND